MKVLEAKGLTKIFPGVVALDRIDISFEQGRIHCIVGENGAGKSTLGLVIEKGRYAYGNRLRFCRPDMKVKMLAFTDIHSLTGIEVTRYDQRLEATVNDLVPTVARYLAIKLFPKMEAKNDHYE